MSSSTSARQRQRERLRKRQRARLHAQGVWQQPARPVFQSETDPQLDIGIAAVTVTAHNVVTQFDNTSYTYYYY